MPGTPKIFPLGDNALTIDFGNEISIELNDQALLLAAELNSRPFPGLIEAVPAYSSVGVFYDAWTVPRFAPGVSAFETVCDLVLSRVLDPTTGPAVATRHVEIPVDFSGEAALDIESLASHSGCSREEVIRIFTSEIYRVYMIGFLPGFAYMGDVDERIAAPRHGSPRLKVPKGSVGIAGRQTGVYPLESPGGWQIIGRTPLEIFTPNAESPCLLRPGDEVRFISI